jgi:hypothetical protein
MCEFSLFLGYFHIVQNSDWNAISVGIVKRLQMVAGEDADSEMHSNFDF